MAFVVSGKVLIHVCVGGGPGLNLQKQGEGQVTGGLSVVVPWTGTFPFGHVSQRQDPNLCVGAQGSRRGRLIPHQPLEHVLSPDGTSRGLETPSAGEDPACFLPQPGR